MINYNNILFFDIETVSLYQNITEFKKNDLDGYELFLKKMKTTTYFKDVDNEEDAYKKYGALFSTYGKIFCISIGFFKKDEYIIKTFHNEDEKILLQEFANLILKVEKKGYFLGGFGILNFDIPWVVRKMIKYDIKIPNILNIGIKKPWEYLIFDILENFKMKSSYVLSLDEVCHELNIDSPKEKLDGSMVYQYYWYDKDYNSIIKYCEGDVLSNMKICKKIISNY